MAILWESIVPPTELTAFARQVPLDQAYILERILPNVYEETLEVEIAETIRTRRIAKARAWDAPPQPGVRDSFETRRVKIPAVSQMMGRGERDRLELERQRSGGQNTRAIEAAMYDDTQNNTESVLARVEVMRGDLLSDGVVTLPELGGIEADFGVPEGNFVAPEVLWSDHENSDWMSDIRGWNRYYRRLNGANMGGMVMSEDRLWDMLNNRKLREMFATYGNVPTVVSVEQMNAALGSFRLPPVAFTYDAKAMDDDRELNIFPPEKVLFLPQGARIGSTRWGITATALEMASANVQVEGSPAGLAAIVDKDARPPYREECYVDAACMPVLERRRALMVADVVEPEDDEDEAA